MSEPSEKSESKILNFVIFIGLFILAFGAFEYFGASEQNSSEDSLEQETLITDSISQEENNETDANENVAAIEIDTKDLYDALYGLGEKEKTKEQLLASIEVGDKVLFKNAFFYSKYTSGTYGWSAYFAIDNYNYANDDNAPGPVFECKMDSKEERQFLADNSKKYVANVTGFLMNSFSGVRIEKCVIEFVGEGKS